MCTFSHQLLTHILETLESTLEEFKEELDAIARELAYHGYIHPVVLEKIFEQSLKNKERAEKIVLLRLSFSPVYNYDVMTKLMGAPGKKSAVRSSASPPSTVGDDEHQLLMASDEGEDHMEISTEERDEILGDDGGGQ